MAIPFRHRLIKPEEAEVGCESKGSGDGPELGPRCLAAHSSTEAVGSWQRACGDERHRAFQHTAIMESYILGWRSPYVPRGYVLLHPGVLFLTTLRTAVIFLHTARIHSSLHCCNISLTLPHTAVVYTSTYGNSMHLVLNQFGTLQ